MMKNDYYGDRFRWFVGVVKDIGDDRSRVRVRIFGIHHTEDQTRVSDGDLPWALVLYPTTGGQTSGGNASHGLVPGTWVVGFFVDGEDSQQPIILGVINGGQNSMDASSGSTPSAVSGNPAAGSSSPSTGGVSAGAEGSAPATGTEPSSTQLSGNSNASKVYNYFYEKISKENSATGDLKTIVAAIVGNFNIESNCSPGAINPNDKGKRSVGIAQWRAERAERFLAWCGQSDMTKNSSPPLEKQLDYVWHEFHTSERSAYNKLLTTGTIQDATAAIILYERDASYKKIGGVWQVDRASPYYTKKLDAARKVLSSMSYTGGA